MVVVDPQTRSRPRALAARSGRASTDANALSLRVFDRSGELAFGIKRGASDDLHAAIALFFTRQNPPDLKRRTRIRDADVGLERGRAQFFRRDRELLGGWHRVGRQSSGWGCNDLVLVGKFAIQPQNDVFIGLQRCVDARDRPCRDGLPGCDGSQIDAIADVWAVDK